MKFPLCMLGGCAWALGIIGPCDLNEVLQWTSKWCICSHRYLTLGRSVLTNLRYGEGDGRLKRSWSQDRFTIGWLEPWLDGIDPLDDPWPSQSALGLKGILPLSDKTQTSFFAWVDKQTESSWALLTLGWWHKGVTLHCEVNFSHSHNPTWLTNLHLLPP